MSELSEGPETVAPQINTPLAQKIKALIRQQQPWSISSYMAACLNDPEHGYYRSQAAIGAGADFTTAPEISQVFGELVGIWAAITWRAMGAPPAFDLVELGPGRGTLMQDALRAGSVVPGFVAAARIHLIEQNPTLAAQQKLALAAYAGCTDWHEECCVLTYVSEADEQTRWIKSIAPGPTIIIANEFLDTMPVNQWIARNGKWHSRGIEVDGDNLSFIELDTWDRNSVGDPPLAPPQPDGAIWQSTEAAWQYASMLSRRAATGPLAALFFDYGFENAAAGDTLQAMSEHRYISPLRAPGLDDLTAHVDFGDMAQHFRSVGLLVDGPITQTEFLLKMGLVERAQALMREARADQVNAIETGARRIADPDGMGGLFKVMAVRSPGVPVLPPFSREGH